MFTDTALQLTLKDINEFESNLKLKLPQKFKSHYLQYNGGVPSNPFIYSDISDIETEIQIFSPIKYLIDGIKVATIEDDYLLYKGKVALMSDYLPFAHDYGGNPLCLSLKSNEIYIIYMDLGEITNKAIKFIAVDFETFLCNMSQESIDS